MKYLNIFIYFIFYKYLNIYYLNIYLNIYKIFKYL